MMAMRSWLVILSVMVLSPGLAHAEAEQEVHERVHVSYTGTALAAISGDGIGLRAGAGAALEITAIPGWLEFEIKFQALSAGDGVDLPIELLIKKPFHVNHWFHPYVGLGPSLVTVIGPDGTGARFGGASAAGAHFWLTRRLALAVEVNYNIIADDGAVHEIGGSAGLLFGN